MIDRWQLFEAGHCRHPEIAARLARTFDNWQRFVPTQRTYMKAALERIQAHETLSRNVAEIINKALTL